MTEDDYAGMTYLEIVDKLRERFPQASQEWIERWAYIFMGEDVDDIVITD